MKPETYALHDRIEREHWWFCGRRRILVRIVREAVAPQTGKKMLDIGCGTGANLAAFTKEYACTGVDICPEAITFAQTRYPDLDLRCLSSAAERAPLVAEADIILLCDVLEHLETPHDFLETIADSMRPGAHLLITVPADRAMWSPHDEAFGHLRRYDMAMLRADYAGLPFREHLISAFNSRLYPVARVVRGLTRRRGRSSGRDGTDLSMPPRPLNRMLERIFAGEAERLLRVWHGDAAPYRRGVSLISLLERTES